MEQPLIYIIILNYNGWQDTIECLESLQQITYSNYKVVIVDNNSTDKSIFKIKDWCNGILEINSEFINYNKRLKPVNYIEYDKLAAENGGEESKEKQIEKIDSHRKLVIINSGKNLGFAGGNNIGINYALKNNADYIMLLNNDTVVDNKFVEPLIDSFKNETKIGIVGGKIYYYDNSQEIAFAGGKMSLIKGSGYHFHDNRFKNSTEVSFLTGCLWLINSNIFKEIGLIDENYFLYLEDTDFCYQVQKAGYKLIYNPDSVIYHKEGKTTGKLSSLSLYYSSRNRPYFVHKNTDNFFIIVLFWLFYISTRIFRIINYGKKRKYIIKGIFDFFKGHKKYQKISKNI
ncbi:hypothetical protein BX659_101171 [Orenia metallireducens]|uniref:glycosyltransferase family 2 protein n=1 Tax=Orenia metallireducens TaxID=1413210 RepID=UPI000D05F765|nr:glycosyltransferase family 2 protein [Orenia metallireducens]PRX35677.1 hypothetical protein BX659_101171 [Orenia metallireducens]